MMENRTVTSRVIQRCLDLVVRYFQIVHEYDYGILMRILD